MKGLSEIPRPYISSILLEGQEPYVYEYGSESIHLYIEDPPSSVEPAGKLGPGGPGEAKIKLIQVTLNLSLKSLWPIGAQGVEDLNGGADKTDAALAAVLKYMQSTTIYYKAVTNKTDLENFLLSENKYDYFMKILNPETLNFSEPGISPPNIYSLMDNAFLTPGGVVGALNKFTYYDDGVGIISFPVSFSHQFRFSLVSSGGNDNPEFLAYIVMPQRLSEQWSPSYKFAAEIIFDNYKTPLQTTYFMIGDTYFYAGSEKPHYALETAYEDWEKDPLTGKPIENFKSSNMSQEVAFKYGPPGAIWCGGVRRVNASKPGTRPIYRYMAGISPPGADPRPYLDLKYKSNDKIIDNRIIGKIENLYKYNSSMFDKLLSDPSALSGYTLHNIIYTNSSDKQKNSLDEYNQKPAIFSEVDYSIYQNKINLFFAIDFLQLLKNNTQLGGLYDKLVAINPAFLGYFVNQIKVISCDISRTNLDTGESAHLLSISSEEFLAGYAAAVGTAGYTDFLGNPLGNEHIWRRIDNLKIAKRDDWIRFYEFRDGEIDVSQYDSSKYTYSVSLKFFDPFINLLFTKQAQVQNIIKDLDELLLKLSLKIEDPNANRYITEYDSLYDPRVTTHPLNGMVDVYNVHYKKINPIFLENVNQRNGALTFPLINEIPASIATAFQAIEFQEYTEWKPKLDSHGNPILTVRGEYVQEAVTKWKTVPVTPAQTVENLALFFVSLNDYEELEPLSAYDLNFNVNEIVNYILNSVKLSNTNPSLLNRIRSLMALLEDKLSKTLSLYGGGSNIKQDVGFQTSDYLKEQGDISKLSKNSSLNVLEYQKTFTKHIDLSITKDYFDWIDPIKSWLYGDNIQHNLKTISSSNYLASLLKYLPSFIHQDKVADFVDLVPANFIPLLSENVLNIFKMRDKPGRLTPQVDFIHKSLQTERKQTAGESSDKLRSITLPEVLAYFGIKFKNTSNLAGTDAAREYVDEKLGFEPHDPSPDSQEFNDNFGTQFDEIGTNDYTGKQGQSGIDPAGVQYNKAGGSVMDKNYEWQGMSYAHYPYDIASQLLNLLFSDNIKNYRDLWAFGLTNAQIKKVEDAGNVQSGFYNPNGFLFDMPFTMNLLRNLAPQNTVAAKTFKPQPMNIETYGGYFFKDSDLFFDDLGKLNISNYQMYISFLCLFGRVSYFVGFQETQKTNKKTPTSYYATTAISSKVWAPLTRDILLEGLASANLLYCKVELYQGGPLIDNAYIDMFSKYCTYNQYFYIIGDEGQTAVINPAGEFIPPRLKEKSKWDIQKEFYKDRTAKIIEELPPIVLDPALIGGRSPGAGPDPDPRITDPVPRMGDPNPRLMPRTISASSLAFLAAVNSAPGMLSLAYPQGSAVPRQSAATPTPSGLISAHEATLHNLAPAAYSFIDTISNSSVALTTKLGLFLGQSDTGPARGNY